MTSSRSWWFVTPVDEDGRSDVGFARPVAMDRLANRAHREQMIDGLLITDWAEPDYALDGGFGDYPRELRGYRLCSDRLRRVLDEAKEPEDRLQWLPARVKNPEKEERRYWVLNLLRPTASAIPGLEDFDWQTLRDFTTQGKLDRYGVLPGPGFGLISFLVSPAVRAAIEKGGCEVAFRHL